MSEIYHTAELIVLLIPHIWPNVAQTARHGLYALSSRLALEEVRL